MKLKLYTLMLSLNALIGVGVVHAQNERTSPLPTNSRYVPVNLNQLANDKSAFHAPSAKIDFNKVPFNLAVSGEKNNLFLKNAGWPNWEKDPLRYYSDYDATPEAPTDTLPVVQIPVDDYSAVYILASCEDDPAYSNVLSLRIGIKNRARQVTYHDFEFTIPRRGENNGQYVVKKYPSTNGNVFLLRLPLNATFAQDFSNHRALDVEITKKIRLAVSKPDPARFQYRPLGLPSGVHIYGMTFERAPLQFFMQGAQTGNIFNQPQTPSFWLRLEEMDDARLKDVTVHFSATDYYGKKTEFPSIKKVLLPTFRTKLELPVLRRGYYVLNARVENAGKVLLEHQTTFALLPKDTRKYRSENPFGTWSNGGSHYTPNDPTVEGQLYAKAGLRYGMPTATREEREQFGLLQTRVPSVRLRGYEKLDEKIAELKANGETPSAWLLFHEDSISRKNVTRTVDVFTGNQYQLDEEEQEKLDLMINIIKESVPKIRRAFPGIRFYLGNGSPPLMEELLRHKLPADLFDALGNESPNFQRLPETQPLDSVANNPSLWMEEKLLEHYGYTNKRVEQGHEVTFPSSSPGNLTLQQQANYMIRHAMHSLAWKLSVVRFGNLTDKGNSYKFSNWGQTGLMFGLPHLTPKPSYVATATMTQMLDGAKFTRIIPTGTTTVYAFEFKKRGNEFVTCVWTPNTPRKVLLKTDQHQLILTDLMFNQSTLSPKNKSYEFIAKSGPVFIESSKPLIIQADLPVTDNLPHEKHTSISALDNGVEWQQPSEENAELGAYNFLQPRLKGSFSVKEVASFEGRNNVLEVKPLNPNLQNWWLPQYTQLKLKEPVTIKGEPTHIGLMVNGNGGWGRIIFELEDAAGQRWTSLGTEQKGAPSPWLADWLTKEEFQKLQESTDVSAGVNDWNSNDAWGRSVINFAGWRYLKFPLPGNYPGEGYHWPYTSQWRCVKADGTRGDYVVHYPLKFKTLSITARAKVLFGTTVVPVRRPAIYLKDLIATYGDPDIVFWKPDAGQR